MALQIKRNDFELIKDRFKIGHMSDKEAIKVLKANGATSYLAKVYGNKGGIVVFAGGLVGMIFLAKYLQELQ